MIPDEKIDNILKNFCDAISFHSFKDDLFIHIAHNVIFCGASGFIEGIGDEGKDYEIDDFEQPDLEILDKPGFFRTLNRSR